MKRIPGAWRRRLGAIVAIGMSCALPASAAAFELAGATYSGTHAAGGTIEFTVATDGSRVTAYRISDVRGDTCMFTAEGDEGVWEGAPISRHAFEYRLYDALVFQGTFSANDFASGSFRMYNAAVGDKPACDTGTVAWTATARPSRSTTPSSSTATPSPTGSPSPTGGVHRTAKKKTYRTRVALRRRARLLVGRLISTSKVCRAGRKVTLKQGPRSIAWTMSKRDGTYSFPRSSSTRGRKVRATVSARTAPISICAAGRSMPVRS
jgi:hypothetical protein